MISFLQKHIALMAASVALVLSGCNTYTDLATPPNIYAGAESPAEIALTSIKAFGAAQDTIITVCSTAVADSLEGNTCAAVIPLEMTLRPAVTSVALVGAEYSDIDARIRELGPEAPAEWLMVAAEVAGRLSAAYTPIRSEVDTFLLKAGELTD